MGGMSGTHEERRAELLALRARVLAQVGTTDGLQAA